MPKFQCDTYIDAFVVYKYVIGRFYMLKEIVSNPIFFFSKYDNKCIGYYIGI